MTRKTNDINNCMNNDNALMMEALRHGHKKVLVEGDEFEDDFFSPGISKLTSKSPYIVRFFAQPGNPKGIITHKLLSSKGWTSEENTYDKATFWLKRMRPLVNRAAKGHLGGKREHKLHDFINGPDDLTPLCPWTFTWIYDATDVWAYAYVHGFIEGEDFIFVDKK